MPLVVDDGVKKRRRVLDGSSMCVLRPSVTCSACCAQDVRLGGAAVFDATCARGVVMSTDVLSDAFTAVLHFTLAPILPCLASPLLPASPCLAAPLLLIASGSPHDDASRPFTSSDALRWFECTLVNPFPRTRRNKERISRGST